MYPPGRAASGARAFLESPWHTRCARGFLLCARPVRATGALREEFEMPVQKTIDQGSRAGPRLDRRHRARSAAAADQRRAAADRAQPRRGHAGRARRHRRDRRQRHPDQGRHHPGGRGRGHRLRHERRAPDPARRAAARQPRQACAAPSRPPSRSASDSTTTTRCAAVRMRARRVRSPIASTASSRSIRAWPRCSASSSAPGSASSARSAAATISSSCAWTRPARCG